MMGPTLKYILEKQLILLRASFEIQASTLGHTYGNKSLYHFDVAYSACGTVLNL